MCSLPNPIGASSLFLSERNADAAGSPDRIAVQVHPLGYGQRLAEWNIDHFPVAQGHHSADPSIRSRADGRRAVAGGQPAVEGGRRAAALDMAEYGHARFVAVPFDVPTAVSY